MVGKIWNHHGLLFSKCWLMVGLFMCSAVEAEIVNHGLHYVTLCMKNLTVCSAIKDL